MAPKPIMIVDDEQALRMVLRRMLELGGYRVTEAADGVEALDCFQRDPPALVITDIFMPRQDGLETIRALRQRHPALPIIAMTGGGSAGQFELLRTATLLGASAVLMKPFQYSDVLEAVRRLLPA